MPRVKVEHGKIRSINSKEWGQGLCSVDGVKYPFRVKVLLDWPGDQAYSAGICTISMLTGKGHYINLTF